VTADTGVMSEQPVAETRHARLFLHVAGWPDRCVLCQNLVRKGDPMIFRHGQDVRWCTNCAALLDGDIRPSKAYLAAFGEDDRLAELRTRVRRTRPPKGEDWSDEIRHPRQLKGRRVRVRRHAAILSDTNPRAPRNTVTQRAQVVKVDHVLMGYQRPDGTTKPTTIRWAGAGGYLREVALDDIDAIAE
jgi:hypothetical protein